MERNYNTIEASQADDLRFIFKRLYEKGFLNETEYVRSIRIVGKRNQ